MRPLRPIVDKSASDSAILVFVQLDRRWVVESMRSGTASGLLEFLKWTQEKGLVKPATAGARRSAAQKVLEIDGEGWRDIDIRALDVEEQFQRFATLRGSKYSPGSLNTYGQRFRDAVALYLEYLGNPTGFRAPPSRSARGGKAKPPRVKRDASNQSPATAPIVDQARATSRDLITYPFPLQNGELAYVQLPVRIEAPDAERLCSFIRSIAIGDKG